MKNYNTLQIERIQRYQALKEKQAERSLTKEEKELHAKEWIARHGERFRRWHVGAIRLNITHSEGNVVCVGSGEFKRTLTRLKEENKRIIQVGKA